MIEFLNNSIVLSRVKSPSPPGDLGNSVIPGVSDSASLPEKLCTWPQTSSGPIHPKMSVTDQAGVDFAAANILVAK